MSNISWFRWTFSFNMKKTSSRFAVKVEVVPLPGIVVLLVYLKEW